MTNLFVFKGLEAIKLENDYLRIIILPGLGGKIASFYHKEKQFELAFQNPKDYYELPSKPASSFEAFDCSGFDDAFPNINESMQCINGHSVLYPDHGEIWSSSFDYRLESDRVCLAYTSPLLNYSYEKIFTLSDTTLHCDYKIHNQSPCNFPYIWTLHALANLEEDMEIIFPAQTTSVENVLDSPYLGKTGSIYDYPEANYKNLPYHFNKMNFFNKVSCEKFYVSHPVSQGFSGIYYPSQKLYYLLEWDAAKLPYLGFWITKGAFKNDYNCALEPSTGYYDCINIASVRKKVSLLAPGEDFSFDLSVSLSPQPPHFF